MENYLQVKSEIIQVNNACSLSISPVSIAPYCNDLSSVFENLWETIVLYTGHNFWNI